MVVTQMTRWTGGNRDAVVAAAKKAKPHVEKAGGELLLGQIHTGPHAGQWLTAARYPNWEIFGKAAQTLAGDAAYQKLLAGVSETNPIAGRVILVGVDL
jgi:hypothetical protein